NIVGVGAEELLDVVAIDGQSPVVAAQTADGHQSAKRAEVGLARAGTRSTAVPDDTRHIAARLGSRDERPARSRLVSRQRHDAGCRPPPAARRESRFDIARNLRAVILAKKPPAGDVGASRLPVAQRAAALRLERTQAG